MGYATGQSARVYASGNDLSAFLRSVKVVGKGTVADVTAIGQTGVPTKAVLKGIGEGTLQAEGLWDPSAGALDAVLGQTFGSLNAVVWLWGGQGSAVDAVMYGCDTYAVGYDAPMAITEAVQVTVEALARQGSAERFTQVHDPTVNDVNGWTGPSVDNGIATSTGLIVYFAIIEPQGGYVSYQYPTIQHSVDNVAWANLSLTPNPGTPQGRMAARYTVAPGVTINRYLRYTMALSGAGTGAKWIGGMARL